MEYFYFFLGDYVSFWDFDKGHCFAGGAGGGGVIGQIGMTTGL
jgi:hypothetical protein